MPLSQLNTLGETHPALSPLSYVPEVAQKHRPLSLTVPSALVRSISTYTKIGDHRRYPLTSVHRF